MRGIATLVVALVLTVTSGIASALSAERRALVIGNDAYANVTALKKANNDARTMAQTLEALGFTVSQSLDADRRSMNSAISQFIATVGEGDTALLFYAGHGVEIEGRNFLLPVDIPNSDIGDSGFIQTESISLDDVLTRLKARNAMLNLVILDACRNNPFTNPKARSLASGQGLARISAPQGTFVMYSADVGEAALDRLNDTDANPNSVFTRTLAPLLKEPGRDLIDTAREVRRRVRDLALTVKHQQTPAYYDAVLGDFFFAGEKAQEQTKTDSKSGETETQPAEQQASLKNDENARETAGETKGETLRNTGGVEQTPGAVAGRALVVTASEKDDIRLWSGRDGKLLGELEGEKRYFSTVRLTDNGSSVAVGSHDGALFSYAIPQFKKRHALYPGFVVSDLAQTPDGALVIAGEDGSVGLVEKGTFNLLWKTRPHAGIVSPVRVLPGGRSAITASEDGTIARISLVDGSIEGRAVTVAGKQITDIAFVSNQLVIAVHEDGTIAHIDLAQGEPVAAFQGGKGWISSVELIDGGRYVTANVDGSLSYFSLAGRNPLAIVRAHDDVAAGAKNIITAGKTLLVSAGFDGAVRFWDGLSGATALEVRHGAAIQHFDLSDGD